ncbi:DUF6702 family protein [Flavobacterium pedocola]
MKPFFQRFVPFFLLVVLCSFTLHKFYVGVYQVNYVPKKKELQITARIFIDDLEKVLEKKYKKRIYLATPKEITETDNLLKSYLNEKLQIKINSSQKTFKFLEKEVEDNVLICYLTAPVSEKIKTLSVYNSVLTEMFPDQQNIMHANINGSKKTLLLTDSEPEGNIEF